MSASGPSGPLVPHSTLDNIRNKTNLCCLHTRVDLKVLIVAL